MICKIQIVYFNCHVRHDTIFKLKSAWIHDIFVVVSIIKLDNETDHNYYQYQ